MVRRVVPRFCGRITLRSVVYCRPSALYLLPNEAAAGGGHEEWSGCNSNIEMQGANLSNRGRGMAGYSHKTFCARGRCMKADGGEGRGAERSIGNEVGVNKNIKVSTRSCRRRRVRFW